MVAGGGLAGVVFLATEAGVLGASAGLLLAASLASSAFTCEERFQLHTKAVEWPAAPAWKVRRDRAHYTMAIGAVGGADAPEHGN